MMLNGHTRREVELVDYEGRNFDRHGTSITVEQKTGTSLGLHKRLQGWAMEFKTEKMSFGKCLVSRETNFK